MLKSTKANIALLAGFAAQFALSQGRTATFGGNEAFRESMIPHHSGALLVCQEPAITDPGIE